MSGFLSRLVAQLFSAPPKVEARTPSMPTPSEAFAPIDSNVSTVEWFSGEQNAARDSIDSNPNTARWYRRPRFANNGPTGHRPSLINGGS